MGHVQPECRIVKYKNKSEVNTYSFVRQMLLKISPTSPQTSNYSLINPPPEWASPNPKSKPALSYKAVVSLVVVFSNQTRAAKFSTKRIRPSDTNPSRKPSIRMKNAAVQISVGGGGVVSQAASIFNTIDEDEYWHLRKSHKSTSLSLFFCLSPASLFLNLLIVILKR